MKFIEKPLSLDLMRLKQEAASVLDDELVRRATEIVRQKMRDFDGTPEEIESHNRLLAECARGDKQAQEQVKALIRKIIEVDYRFAQPPLSDVLVKRIYEDSYGLGPIDELFNDPLVNEIQVNGAEHIWVERAGKKYRVDRHFKDDGDVVRTIRLLLGFDGKDITAMQPKQEARLFNGSRLTVTIPPMSKRPYINIRKFDAFDLTTENLVSANTLSLEMVSWLEKAVKGRSNVLIIGETGSGKTSLLKWLVGFMNPNLRLGTIETTFELKLDEKYPERNIFSYEEHPELNITMSDLFITCLRSTPDIIICGEARGKEADELIRAMRRGHPGSIGTLHTNSPETCIDDIAAMINEDGRSRDPIQLRHHVASAVNLIIQMRQFEDTGTRRVTRITEVIPSYSEYTWKLQDIWRYIVDPNKPSQGQFVKVGNISDELKEKLNFYGLPLDEIKDM